MPLLTPSAVHIDQPLSNLTLAYAQSQENFIADKVFPTVGVPLTKCSQLLAFSVSPISITSTTAQT